MDLFEHLVIKEIPTISPAFRWAQSLNTTYLEVKWATRFDSPACLDIFDQEYSIEDYQKIHISAMCRNDKKLLRYSMSLELQDCVDEEPISYFESSSVGRLFVSLAKLEDPSRWKRLLADDAPKPSNMNIWWDVHEKHEKDLEMHQKALDEAAEEQSKLGPLSPQALGLEQKPRKKKTKKVKSKKERKEKGDKQEHQDS